MKKFTTYNHLVVMLFTVFEGYSSLRETILGLLANSHRLSHLGLGYLVRRGTLSEANQRRSSKVFEDIYISVYRQHAPSLPHSQLGDSELKRLYIMDSSTLSLFKNSKQHHHQMVVGCKLLHISFRPVHFSYFSNFAFIDKI